MFLAAGATRKYNGAAISALRRRTRCARCEKPRCALCVKILKFSKCPQLNLLNSKELKYFCNYTNPRSMKKLHLSLLCCLFAMAAFSQKVYFIYIQTESEQPFYVKMNEKVQSSSASGYIILSKLVDSTYSFTIGFPQNKWASQKYTVALGKKDHGYLLKNFGDKGWGLFDLQTLAVQMGVNDKTGYFEGGKGEVGDVSAFTEVLARAANDPSLREKPVKPVIELKKQEVVAKNEPPVTTPSTTTNSGQTSVTETITIMPAIPGQKEPVISVSSESAAVTNKEVVAAPTTEDKPKDEITMPASVPVAKENGANTATVPVVKEENTKPAPAVVTEVIVPETKKEQEKETVIKQDVVVATGIMETPVFDRGPTQVRRWSESSTSEGFGVVYIDIYGDGSMDTIRIFIPNQKTLATITKEEPQDEKAFIATKDLQKNDVEKTSACADVATDNDFLKLRKLMAATESDDDMIVEAKKAYKVKCYTTLQVKNLGALFLTDEGKYKFFDASYQYVADAAAFNSLQSELKDEYYTTRFKAMLRN